MPTERQGKGEPPLPSSFRARQEQDLLAERLLQTPCYRTAWPVASLPATRPWVIAMPMELPANGVA